MKRRIPVDAGTLKPGDLELPPESAHYARQVLRLGHGEEVELFDGAGRAARARISGLLRDDVMVTIEEVFDVPPARPAIRLYQCIPKGDRWELVIEKATELGVTEIVPVTSRRSVVKVPAKKIDRKLDRWRRIALAASRQCGRYYAPTVTKPMDLAQTIATNDSDLRLVCDPLAEREELGSHLDENPESVGVWIGPEGGLTDEEIDLLVEHGATRLFLAESVLRSETAGIFAVGLIRYLAGGSA